MAYDDFGHLSKSAAFVRRRIIGIVPTYWIATFVAFALYAMSFSPRHPSFLELLKSLTFIPYSTNLTEDIQPVVGQGWTLNYEMFFYALFAITLTVPRRIGLPALFLAFVGIVGLGAAWLKPFSDLSPATNVPTFLANPIILLFAAGMAIGVLKKKFQFFTILYPFQIMLAFIGTQLAGIVMFHISFSRIPFPDLIWTWIPGILAVITCAFAAPATQRGRFETISETLGEASYSTYLFHIFIVFALGKVFPLSSPMLAVLFVIIVLVTSNVFGVLFFRIIEQPVSRFFRSIFTVLPSQRSVAHEMS
jgi:exopolysaccharide production protein ExoZ